jgi:hypothetical protein
MSHKDCKIKNYSGFGLKPIFYSGFGYFGCYKKKKSFGLYGFWVFDFLRVFSGVTGSG